MRRKAVLIIALLPLGCGGFESVRPDAGSDVGGAADVGQPDVRAGEAGADGPVADQGLQLCPPNLPAPSIVSFAITDALDVIALNEEIGLVVSAQGHGAQPLRYSWSVSPSADAVLDKGDGVARWARSSAAPVFFSTRHAIRVDVSYACSGGPTAQDTVHVTVLGNVLVADIKKGTIEAVGSDGAPIGQLVGPAAVTSPTDLLLIGPHELAVGDLSAKLVKVIDLQQQKVVRSFGADAPGLKPLYLDRTPAGDILVAPADKNKIARYSKQGQLQQLITAPHPYEVAGLAHQSDGTIIAGISGAGTQYAFSATGVSLGPFATPQDAGDTNSLLAIAGDEVLLGLRSGMNDGKLVRVSSTGAVQATVPGGGPGGHTFYYLRRFSTGYLFVHFFDNSIFRLSPTLQVETQPFATLGSTARLGGMAWLDSPPAL